MEPPELERVMESELAKYRSFHRSIKIMMKVIGLWPTDDSNRLVERTLNWTIVILGVVASLAILCFSLNHRSNVYLLTSGMSINVSFMTMFLKVACLMTYRNCLLDLNVTLEKHYNEDLKVLEYRPSLLKRMSVFRGFSRALIVSVAIAASSLVIAPIKRMITDNKYTGAYPTIYPISYEPGRFIYWCIFLTESVTCFSLWIVTCAVDSAYGFYVFQICGLLRVLGLQFRNLSSAANYSIQLKECVKRHQTLMRCRDNLQQLFGFIVIYLCITASLCLCALVFQVSKIQKIHSGIILKLAMYIFSKLLQTFTYAWGGNLITVESEASLNAIYDSKWPGSGDKRLMNDVLIVLSQKPISVKFKEFFVITLDVFKAVVNTSVSYFFLLDTLDSN